MAREHWYATTLEPTDSTCATCLETLYGLSGELSEVGFECAACTARVEARVQGRLGPNVVRQQVRDAGSIRHVQITLGNGGLIDEDIRRELLGIRHHGYHASESQTPEWHEIVLTPWFAALVAATAPEHLRGQFGEGCDPFRGTSLALLVRSTLRTPAAVRARLGGVYLLGGLQPFSEAFRTLLPVVFNSLRLFQPP